MEIITHTARSGADTIGGRTGVKKGGVRPADSEMWSKGVSGRKLSHLDFVVPLLVHGTPLVSSNVESRVETVCKWDEMEGE